MRCAFQTLAAEQKTGKWIAAFTSSCWSYSLGHWVCGVNKSSWAGRPIPLPTIMWTPKTNWQRKKIRSNTTAQRFLTASKSLLSSYWISICIIALQVSFQQIQKRFFFSDRNSLNPVALLEERTGFTGLSKHMGNYVYRGVVRRVSHLRFAFCIKPFFFLHT